MRTLLPLRGSARSSLKLVHRTIFLALLTLALPAAAQDVEVELVLLADASGSIDMGETLFQRQGYADAITDPRVLSAIALSAYGKIAVTYVEWASAGEEDVVVPWTIIDGPESAEAFLAKGWKVAVVDNLSTGRKGNLPPGADFRECDITDPTPSTGSSPR